MKIENPKGLWIQWAERGDAPLEPAETYKVGFITSKGVPPQWWRNRANQDINAIAVLEKWFTNPPWTNGGLASVGRMIVI